MDKFLIGLGLGLFLVLAVWVATDADAKVQVEPMGNCTFYYAVAWMRDELPRPLPYGSAYLGFVQAVQGKCDGEGEWR
ncbi:hypothetical protein LCGC14_2797840 [marine sediment metagenome]|uniref:Uncharacterized protein n=1 Tax=marine sediment metagenome TaxID=412755 RepID=A0A0F8YNK9_9ZZZZ